MYLACLQFHLMAQVQMRGKMFHNHGHTLVLCDKRALWQELFYYFSQCMLCTMLQNAPVWLLSVICVSFAEATQVTSTQGATLTQLLLVQHTTPRRLTFPQWVCITSNISHQDTHSILCNDNKDSNSIVMSNSTTYKLLTQAHPFSAIYLLFNYFM